MSPSQIASALEKGQLTDVLAGRDPAEEETVEADEPEQATLEQVRKMTGAQVVQAHNEGRLDLLLGIER